MARAYEANIATHVRRVGPQELAVEVDVDHVGKSIMGAGYAVNAAGAMRMAATFAGKAPVAVALADNNVILLSAADAFRLARQIEATAWDAIHWRDLFWAN
jgi:hypothetical protein